MTCLTWCGLVAKRPAKTTCMSTWSWARGRTDHERFMLRPDEHTGGRSASRSDPPAEDSQRNAGQRRTVRATVQRYQSRHSRPRRRTRQENEMKVTDEEKTELARKLAAEWPWSDGGTARKAIGVLDEAGSLRVRGREVLPEEIPSGSTARVEYDVLTKNHMTGEFVITRHMEITGRKVPDPRSVAVAHEKVANEIGRASCRERVRMTAGAGLQ